jgi:hypothetical protein
MEVSAACCAYGFMAESASPGPNKPTLLPIKL